MSCGGRQHGRRADRGGGASGEAGIITWERKALACVTKGHSSFNLILRCNWASFIIMCPFSELTTGIDLI